MNEMVSDFIANWNIMLLIFTRMLAMFSVAPFFGNRVISYKMRITFALIITFMISQMVIAKSVPVTGGQVSFILSIINELLIGLAFGFLIMLAFNVFQIAGQLFSLQMGFGISQFFDPLQETQASLLGQFLSLFGLLIFFSIGGHLLVIEGIYDSYYKFPIVTGLETPEYLKLGVITIFSDTFSIAMQIALPVIATVLLITVSLGILARFAPQLNIFILGFPIYIVVGLLTLIAGAYMMFYVGAEFILETIHKVTRMFGGEL